MGKNHQTRQYRHAKEVALWLHNHNCALFNCPASADAVHHINKNSTDNKLSNLLPLCNEHHKILHLAQAKPNYTNRSIIVLLLRKISDLLVYP